MMISQLIDPKILNAFHALIAPGYARIRVVASFDELVSTQFGGGVNALCWPRTLPGDFGEIVEKLGGGDGINAVDDDELNALNLTAAGVIARSVLLSDQHLLRSRELAPLLNCIHGCARDADDAPVATDVFSFHVDSATVESDTYLCTYFGPSSEGLRNDEAQKRVEIPETRARLLALYGGQDDAGFRAYLHEHYYDLHYAALPQARPFSFGVGNLWRIATEHPGCPVPPCIHRAPATFPGQLPRLLLIS
jgi:hypothetical protein